MDFISLTNYELHREHLRQLKLRMSIFEKSYPSIKGKSPKQILKLPLDRTEREPIADLLADILAHELYFNSFSSANTTSPLVRATYDSEANFLYVILQRAEECRGFLFVVQDRRGQPDVRTCDRPLSVFLSNDTPVLALDLSEHAYFYDYYFDKQSYVKAALSRLDLSKIKKS